MKRDADRDLSAVLESIDGALADAEFPDAMRWSPTPSEVTDAPAPFDGSLVWQPPQRYEVLPGAWVREYDRDHPRPGFRGGAVPDRVILDEVFPVLPPDLDRDTLAGQWREAAERVGIVFRDLVSAFGQACESLGRLGSNLRPLLDQLREAGVIPTEAPSDPRARAMWHKARQGTGPDTQIQHRPRPRRHVL